MFFFRFDLDIGRTELEVAAMVRELKTSIKNVIKRIKDLIDQYKDSGSINAGDIEHLQKKGEELRKSYEDPSGELAKIIRQYAKKKNRERLKVEIESKKIEIKNLDESLDVLEAKFCKYNVPKRFQMNSEQPLKRYLENLHKFMKITWRKEAEKNRVKKQRSLIEWMEKLDQSNEEEKIAFNALKTAFSEIGIQISKFFIKYFLLIMEVSDMSEEIMALSLYEVEAVLKCLTVEENSNSIVVNTFVSMVQFFERELKSTGPFGDDSEGWKREEDTKEEPFTYFLEDEMKDDLLNPIIVEVLRLEVSFCSPDLPMKVINDIFYSMAKHLVDNVFEEKLKGVAAKIDEFKSDFLFVQGEESSKMKIFQQALDDGVKKLWTEFDLKGRSITN